MGIIHTVLLSCRMNDITGIQARGVTRPRWGKKDKKESQFLNWPARHPAAPWQLDITPSEWEALVIRSSYFRTVQQSREKLLPRNLAVTNIVEHEDHAIYDLYIPLWTNVPIKDAVSRSKPDAVTFIGESHALQTVSFSQRRKATLMVNLYHLLIGIVLLLGYDGCYDTILGQNVISFLNVIRFLGAPELVVYMAQNVINVYNIALFRVHLWALITPDKLEFKKIMRIIRYDNPLLHGEGFDLDGLNTLFYQNIPNRRLACDRRKNLIYSYLFWKNQRSCHCGICGMKLVNYKVSTPDSIVDITECCNNVVCRPCWECFLKSSHTCVHTPPCDHLSICFVKTCPFIVCQVPPIQKCPICAAGYSRGFFSLRYCCSDDADRMIKERRGTKRNLIELQGPHRQFYLSTSLRDLVNSVYHPKNQVMDDPYKEYMDLPYMVQPSKRSREPGRSVTVAHKRIIR